MRRAGYFNMLAGNMAIKILASLYKEDKQQIMELIDKQRDEKLETEAIISILTQKILKDVNKNV